MTTTSVLVEYARQHGGIITTNEAAALGIDRAATARRVRDGVLVRVGRGVMALPGTASRPDLVLRAATRGLPAVVSHESAAKLHGLEPIVEKIPTVSVTHRTTNRFGGARVHQLTDLADAHIILVDGLRVTSPERTLIDLAAVVTRARLRRLLEDGLEKRIVDGALLISLFDAIARRGKPGTKAMRLVLDETLGDPGVSESALERRTLRLIREAGLPPPAQQYTPDWLRPENGRVDFAYPDSKLVVEVDGRRWHSRTDSFERDRRRDNDAQLAGWRVLRFTWTTVSQEPDRVIAAIESALPRT